MSDVRELAVRGKRAARALAKLGSRQKDDALRALGLALRESVSHVVEANHEDLARAREAGLGRAMLERLTLDAAQLERVALAVEHVMGLEDPVGARREMRRLPNGLLVGKERVPLGLIAMIYESRPGVTVDAASLAIKSGNAVLLRGGKEASATNAVLGEILAEALAEAGLPPEAAQIVPATDREGIRELLGLSGLVDLAIPRGGEGLIRFVAEHARVPVIKHYKGVCHLYLDEGCEPSMAIALAVNGKAQRPGVCNALECLLVNAKDASGLLPRVADALLAAGVELRGCPRTLELVPRAKPAAAEDWGAEFLDLVLAVRVVEDLDAALEHVERYGSHHSEAICTPSHQHAQRWLAEVDASCVLVNASTRFNDGGELGLGAEIGISTDKLHAYGPMGLESLTSEKWIVLGDGQTRS
ncbi:MAG: glutamate-5-semialdehyde dehydrogenase [Sorangiineae bacterium]|nr:glutamate-5-semialdehyde dehydrogenase [Polyangiaceae bacterium]MEB2322491.1 glutamate-5-semialdehyde dehydrogenase [Sorangiineae bacterium]